METSKTNQQEYLHAKELQKFLNNVKGVLMIPKDSKQAVKEYSTVGFLLSEETFVNFKDYWINKVISELLEDKYPILSIKTEENSSMVGLSIIDKDSGYVLSYLISLWIRP